MPDAPGPHGAPSPGDQAPPSYTKYRSRPRLLPRRQTDAVAELRERGAGSGGDGPRKPRPRPARVDAGSAP